MSHAPTANLSSEQVVAKQFGAINRHDAEALASLYSEDAVVYDPMYPEPLKGRTAITKDFIDFFAAVPDLQITVTQTFARDRAHAVEFIIRGVHGGPLKTPDGDIPATNRRIELGGSGFARTDAEGRITHERRYYNLAAMISQLGITA